jgi:uncharacterized delta-60 repeat protein
VGVIEGRDGKLAAALIAVLATLALAAPAPAATPAAKQSLKAGALDRSFGGDGKVAMVFPEVRGGYFASNYRLPYEFATGRIAMARGSGGTLVVANSEAIVRFLANGRRDPRFGGNGSVPIGDTAGLSFQLADIAVDSKGRVLIAGTTRATNNVGMEGKEVAGPLPSIGTIRRYTSSGALDPSFGAGGVLHSFFGAPPPTFQGSAYDEPAVSIVGLAVDGQDRPIVTGTAVTEVGRCAGPDTRYQRSQAFIARRAAVGGGPDPSFAGAAGSAAIGGLAWLSLPTLTPAGVFAVGEAEDPCRSGGPEEPSVLTGMGDGGLLSGFSGDGLWSRPFVRVSDVAPAPGGKVALLIRTIELRKGEWVESAGRAMLLRANGAIERRFGVAGEADISLPKRGSIAAIAVDRKGRVLLAGALARKIRYRKGKSIERRFRIDFLLMRTTPDGEPDRRFGRRGQVIAGFGKRANVRASELLVDRAGRISVGGKLAGPSGDNAFAIARYKSGR